MKKRIIVYFAALFLIFLSGVCFTLIYLTNVTSNLSYLMKLHGIEVMRQDLVINVQAAQANLYTIGTAFGKELDSIVENVNSLSLAVKKCSSCHHHTEVKAKIDEVGQLIVRYENSLSEFITTVAVNDRVMKLQKEASIIGNDILFRTQDMALAANAALNKKTVKAMEDINDSRIVLFFTLILALIGALLIAVTLTRQITKPVYELVKASREIESGNLGYKTAYSGKDEFLELANSFNEMSFSLKDSNEKIMQHMNRLSGLYRITLPLHSISNINDIFREVSYGVAEVLNAEQCGLMLLNKDLSEFEHKYPAYGLDEMKVRSIRVKKDDVLQLYFARNRKPLFINDMQSEELPSGFTGNNTLNVKNLLLGWVRQKGELVGIIRVADRKLEDFSEESLRLMGIISNNLSVALENIRLYDDLKTQMKELKETQEQLVQAAKLAAIGELASNVAHEINNPLTSIMGYAELIKEETEIDIIMNDVDIIEKESLRARDIVQQLLEFSRKKPLEIKKIELNNLIKESVSLVGMNIKDAGIKVVEDYSELPVIVGDPNQLKQVFLNIINNAVDALPEGGGEINIRTFNNNKNVTVEVSDNGYGIPDDVLSRIFEPFFTTKREKGTGIGLSISHKIIQSHKGKIDIRSEEHVGTKVIITLPVFSG
jgi:signal transduction histidine kinase/HAMP domain-containing protein